MSSETAAKIVTDLTASMKSRNALRTEVLRSLKSELRYWEIEAKRTAEEADCHKVLRAAQKKRRDAIEAYRKGDREELAAKEEAELAIISEYLPADMPEEELVSIVESVITEVQASSSADLGHVMKLAMQKVAGRTDGNRVRQVAADILARQATEDVGE